MDVLTTSTSHPLHKTLYLGPQGTAYNDASYTQCHKRLTYKTVGGPCPMLQLCLRWGQPAQNENRRLNQGCLK